MQDKQILSNPEEDEDWDDFKPSPEEIEKMERRDYYRFKSSLN